MRSGESLNSALSVINPNKVESVLFNCSQPEVMANAIKITKNFFPAAILTGAYANRFPPINSSQRAANVQLREIREELTPEMYQHFAIEWLKLGAEIFGGCCGIGPEHIRELCILKKSFK